MRFIALLLSAALTASFAPTAGASLVGDTVTFKVVDPVFGGTFGPQDAEVGSGVEFSVSNVVDVDLSALSILVSFREAFPLGANLFEFYWTDLDWIESPGSVTDVSLTVFQGPEASNYNLAFTDNTITLISPKFSTPVMANDWFRLDVEVSRTGTVPEPSTLALCAFLLLAGLSPQVRRRLGMGTSDSR